MYFSVAIQFGKSLFTNLHTSWAASGNLPTRLQSGLLAIKDVGKQTNNKTLIIAE